MTEEQSAAYVFACCTRALVKAMGMQALNKQRETLGHSMAYDDEAFFDLLEAEGAGENQVLTVFQQWVPH